MTTPRPPDPPDPPDAELAARLAVEPLDADTRARLVRTALAGSEPQRRDRPWRVLAVAAALLVVLTVGLDVLVPRGGDEDTALRATDSSESKADRSLSRPESQGESAPTANGPDTTSGAAPTTGDERLFAPLDGAFSMELRELASIGAVGNVSTPARLRRAVSSHVPPAAGARTAAVPACATAAARAVGTPVAVGTGRIDGAPATVVVVTTPTGSTTALALRNPDCTDLVSAGID